MTHVAFSDDSADRSRRFHSLAVVSMTSGAEEEIDGQIRKVLRASSISEEFKWHFVASMRYKECAENLLDLVFRYSDRLRIDVLIWDIEDSRHKDVQGRDDLANLGRMYYHLTSDVFSRRWPIPGVSWTWYPDPQSSIDWQTLQRVISGKIRIEGPNLFSSRYLFRSVTLNAPKPSDSSARPLIQLADLFAGIAAYSFGSFTRFQSWKRLNSGQLDFSLFDSEPISQFSNAERARFPVLQKLQNLCKASRLPISFESSRGFLSYQSSPFLRFWLWQPQHSADKAPTKEVAGQHN